MDYRNNKKIKSIESLTKSYSDKVESKTNKKFSLIGTYNDKAVKLEHKECGRVFELNPRYFLSKLHCPVCAREKKYEKRVEKTKTIISEFKNKMYSLVGEDYSVLKDFMDPDERKVSIKHNVCGKEYKVKINSFNSGRRCPDCTKTKKKDPREYEREFNELVKGRCTLISEYERATVKVKIRCNKCNVESIVNPSAFLKDSRCPNCEKKPSKKRKTS